MEKYIKGKLTGMELEKFKAGLIQNPELLSDVKFSQRSMIPSGSKSL